MSAHQTSHSSKLYVIPTDTVYGLVASAFDQAAVERIFAIKNRNNTKPLIILIDDIAQLEDFGVTLDEYAQQLCKQYWPGPVSIIFPTPSAPEYLHRGTDSLAFRLPSDEALRAFIREHGPIVAPSANPESDPPATTLAEAQAYFGDAVDEYIDGGVCNAKPSRLLRLNGGEVEVLRD